MQHLIDKEAFIWKGWSIWEQIWCKNSSRPNMHRIIGCSMNIFRDWESGPRQRSNFTLRHQLRRFSTWILGSRRAVFRTDWKFLTHFITLILLFHQHFFLFSYYLSTLIWAFWAFFHRSLSPRVGSPLTPEDLCAASKLSSFSTGWSGD